LAFGWNNQRKEDAMRMRMIVALLLATAAIGPAAAQLPENERGGVRTETQDRLAGMSYDLIWNFIGLLGLLGLLGLKGQHSEDSYHPSPLD
jgi:hypothetical protein